ncbi:MAG: hypothetical protein K0R39_178 [Symbiobacteriaceae bacterium]|jgi:hypothetical protein|nr:hypothetical protein [Symbiobacteriaceae bacterium]
MMGSSNRQKWVGSLLAGAWAALLLSGCAAPTDGRSGLPVAQGMHLLADAELNYQVTGAGRLEVSYVVHLVNGGTEKCDNLFQTLNLPPALAAHQERGGWTGVTQPFAPGHRGNMSGEMQFRGFSVPSREELESWLSEATITVNCGSRYGNTVVPTVVPRPQ